MFNVDYMYCPLALFTVQLFHIILSHPAKHLAITWLTEIISNVTY